MTMACVFKEPLNKSGLSSSCSRGPAPALQIFAIAGPRGRELPSYDLFRGSLTVIISVRIKMMGEHHLETQ